MGLLLGLLCHVSGIDVTSYFLMDHFEASHGKRTTPEVANKIDRCSIA